MRLSLLIAANSTQLTTSYVAAFGIADAMVLVQWHAVSLLQFFSRTHFLNQP